jgi:hypothetical protein
VNGKSIPRRKNYPQLLKEYERNLKRRELNGEIREVTRKTYLNDANRILESLLVASSREEIRKIMVTQQYKGYYANIINDLKAIIVQRTL